MLLALALPIQSEPRVLVASDLRLSPTSAPLVHRIDKDGLYKTINFTFWSGNLFQINPRSHIWVMADGHIEGGSNIPLQGRGVTIGSTHKCKGVGFEWFGGDDGLANDFPPGCIPLQIESNTHYDFEIKAGPNYISAELNGEFIIAYFTRWYPSFDTIIGVAGDDNTSMYAFFDVIHNITD